MFINVVHIAQVAHEAIKAINDANGDTSMPHWNEAADWQMESTIKGVNFKLNNPDATPETQHQAWMKARLEAGWVYGETKMESLRTHPCLVPYNDLPFEQRVKDYVFIAIVKAMAFPHA